MKEITELIQKYIADKTFVSVTIEFSKYGLEIKAETHALGMLRVIEYHELNKFDDEYFVTLVCKQIEEMAENINDILGGE